MTESKERLLSRASSITLPAQLPFFVVFCSKTTLLHCATLIDYPPCRRCFTNANHPVRGNVLPV